MSMDNRDDQRGEELERLLGGLQQLARHFDAQEYPGQAWPDAGEKRGRTPFSPLARPRTSRRLMRQIAAAAAAAALLAVVAYYGTNSPPPIRPTPGHENALAPAPSFPQKRDLKELATPQLVIVEDVESYSLIDLTSGVPLVSFATRDSYSPACVVPLLPEPPSPEAAPDKKT